MRPDMSHVIVERPRHGGGWARKGRVLDHDDLPSHEGIRRAHRRGRKYLNENLNPLKRFLCKQVGRPWDAVYAEICANLRPDSTVQQHVRDHVENYVLFRAGHPARPYLSGYRGRPWYQPLYVDPQDGLLKRTDDLPHVKAARRAEQEKLAPTADRVPLGPEAELRRIDGLWYEIRLAPLPEPKYVAFISRESVPGRQRSPRVSVPVDVVKRLLDTPPVEDAVSRVLIPAGPTFDTTAAWREYRRAYPDRRYAVAKRRLSRAKLRQHGLADQLPAA